jgi:hypothetical protein
LKDIVYDKSRISIESLSNVWSQSVTWEDRLSELADHRKIHGTAMFLGATAKTSKLIVATQGKQYRLHKERHRV